MFVSPRQLLTALAVAALLYAALALFVRARPLSRFLALVVAVGTPYVPLVAAIGFVLAALCRRVLLSIVAVAVVVVTVAVQVPWYYFGDPANVGQHADIRVLSSNLRKGRADAPSFVRLARDSADVITVAELTTEEVQRFSHAGIGDVFPHSVLIPAPGAGGGDRRGRLQQHTRHGSVPRSAHRRLPRCRRTDRSGLRADVSVRPVSSASADDRPRADASGRRSVDTDGAYPRLGPPRAAGYCRSAARPDGVLAQASTKLRMATKSTRFSTRLAGAA